ncbi:recombinase family protein [Massilia sp. LC238]|uniref:recombinase family protein n=1 Tax=Massilia sp. LC238 TaxID=1502852 RepID=UPI0004E38F8D|nr:recombinase family protein [Massilia sp. LC238]KFC76185.1 Serine-based site-specific recombinase activity TnpR [Massilia sp. LC238]
MSNIAYYRVSTNGQSTEAQRAAMSHGINFDKEFSDEGVSGGIPALHRPGFNQLMSYVREGDTVHVYAVDRLGRDAIDVQMTIKSLLARNVTVHVRGLGPIAAGVGELIVAVLAQVAEMEKARIAERTSAGRSLAKKSLTATGLTHRGKESLGRPAKADAAAVKMWKVENKKSISATARHFQLSESTVKRYCAAKLSNAA